MKTPRHRTAARCARITGTLPRGTPRAWSYNTPVGARGTHPSRGRVRHQAREAAALMAFSAATSSALTAGALVPALPTGGSLLMAGSMDDPIPRPGPLGPGRCPSRACPRPRGRRPCLRDPRPRRAHRGRPRGGVRSPASSASTETPMRWPRRGSGWPPTGTRFTGLHAVYDEIPEVLDDLGLEAVDAVLFDLGVSSGQLDVVERGFAYREDAPLDMRMDGSGQSGGPTAADVLNTYSAPDLARVLREYGEERFARQDRQRRCPAPARPRALHHVGAAGRAPVRRHPGARPTDGWTPGQAHVPGPAHGGQRRARRAAPAAPPAAIDAIAVGGRVVVEAYHLLEDRLVKRAFVEATRSERPVGPPVRPGRPRAGLPAADPWRREGRPRRGRPQPSRRQRPAARPRTTRPNPLVQRESHRTPP